MSEIFKHTQNISSVSKLVLIVKNLETNVEKFMKKIIYYEQYFKNIKDKLPPELYLIVRKLILRCYEYRNSIREELNSKIAYIADIGRWIIGIEDWNTKMDKRSGQLLELVTLSNSLITLYYVNGKITNMSDDLMNYINSITGIIILDNNTNWDTESKYIKKIELIEAPLDIVIVDSDNDELNPFN